jgi:hypothetical protein
MSPIITWLNGSNACSDRGDVTEVWDTGPALGEYGAGVGVDLGEADGAPSGSLKPKVKAADAGEEGGMGEVMQQPGPPAARCVARSCGGLLRGAALAAGFHDRVDAGM